MATAPATDTTWELLGRLALHRRDQVFALAAELELSPPQLFALQHLEPGTPLPMSSLAGLLRCDNSNVTGIVDRLEARGLVERRAATHDRRVKHLVVTDAGVALREELVSRLQAPPVELSRLDDAEQRQLRALLHKVLDD